jgi:hypothetical protein
MDRLLRVTKYLSSFLKREWSLSDYPIRVRENPHRPELPPDSRRKPIRWSAQVIGWPTLFGHGETRAGAYADLAESFQLRRASGKPLPRPGTDYNDIEIAPIDRLAELEHLAPKFFSDVLDLNYADCLITDQSSLWDFHDQTDNSHYLNRIRDVYGIDVSNIDSARIVDILDRVRILSPSA